MKKTKRECCESYDMTGHEIFDLNPSDINVDDMERNSLIPQRILLSRRSVARGEYRISTVHLCEECNRVLNLTPNSSKEHNAELLNRIIACVEKKRADAESAADDELVNFKSAWIEPKKDNINPAHYKGFHGTEVIDIIKKNLTTDEFAGYCKGNSFKYRLRAGRKGDAKEDIEKAQWYEEKLR